MRLDALRRHQVRNGFAVLGVGALTGLALALLLEGNIPWSMFMVAGIAGAFYSGFASWRRDREARVLDSEGESDHGSDT